MDESFDLNKNKTIYVKQKKHCCECIIQYNKKKNRKSLWVKYANIVVVIYNIKRTKELWNWLGKKITNYHEGWDIVDSTLQV